MESAGGGQKYAFIVCVDMRYYAQCTFRDHDTHNTADTFKLNLHFEYFFSGSSKFMICLLLPAPNPA